MCGGFILERLKAVNLFTSYLVRESLLQKWNSYCVKCKTPLLKLPIYAEHNPLVASNITTLFRPLGICF